MIPVQDGVTTTRKATETDLWLPKTPIRGEMRVSEVEGGGVPEAFLAAA